MKKILLLVLVFMANSSLLLAEGEQCVTLVLRNSTRVNFAFSQKPVIVTGHDNIEIFTADAKKISYALADVKRILTNEKISTGIASGTKQKGVAFRITDNTVVATGLHAGELVCVYSMAGIMVMRTNADTDGNLSLPLGSLEKGSFVVRTERGICYKLYGR